MLKRAIVDEHRDRARAKTVPPGQCQKKETEHPKANSKVKREIDTDLTSSSGSVPDAAEAEAIDLASTVPTIPPLSTEGIISVCVGRPSYRY